MKKQSKFVEKCDRICELNKKIEAEKDLKKKNVLLIQLHELERQLDKIALVSA